MTANKEASVRKLGDPPAARPNAPAINKVILKHHLFFYSLDCRVKGERLTVGPKYRIQGPKISHRLVIPHLLRGSRMAR